MSKDDEKRYYGRLDNDGRLHADGKPFSDNGCGRMLIDFGQILTFLPPPPSRVLDMGCGTGWTSSFLARTGYDVTAMDISLDMIRSAKRIHSQSSLDFIVGDFENVPVASTFDAVVSYGSLHHCANLSSALRGCWQALKPNGLLILMEPGEGHSDTETSLKFTAEYGLTERSLPPGLLKSTLHTIGFRDVQTIPWLSLFSAWPMIAPDQRSWKYRITAFLTGHPMADVIQWFASARKTALVVARRC